MIALRTARVAVALTVLGGLIAGPAYAAWTPPIGIPAPSFGINEVARATPNPWTVSTPGFYYVDATNGAATDTSNPYGTPARPRRTIPNLLPAGAVVELHGTYDNGHSSPNTIIASGTAANPVYIRGVSPTSRPLARRNWELQGTYMIVENIEFGPMPDMSATGSVVIRLPGSHLVLRNSDVHGTPTDGGVGVVQWEVPYGVQYTGPGLLDNIVLYHNTIHDNGDVNATFDQDVHGIGVSDHVQYLWVVDNEIYRNSGDGIQINAGPQLSTTHHLYIGRNISHDNKQTGFWVKQATDVILSQNESYGHRPGNSSLGQCMGAQYAPDWVWFIYNHVHDCEYGIAQASDNQEFSHTILVGNIIENIHRSQASNPASAWGPSAVMMSGGYERHIINNTIYNVDSGVNIATPAGSAEIADNIISTVTQPQADHVLLDFANLAPNVSFHHNLLFGDARINFGNGQVHLTTAQLASVMSLNTDPQFLNPTAADFHTAATSPAANHAEFNSIYTTFMQRYGVSIAFDAAGNVRPQAATTDMGAYLSAGSLNQAPTISAITTKTTNEDTPITVAFTIGDAETAAASLTVTTGSSNTALVPNANVVAGGSGANRTVTITPSPNQSGTTLISITVSDGNRTTSTAFLLSVTPVNDPPTISAIANQMTLIGAAKGPLAFTVSDVETAAGSLMVSATSSNPALVPNANVMLGGSGANRTVTVVPLPGRTGITTITLTVSDGGLTAATTFTMTVPSGGSDFDGDGKADVLLRNKVTGQNVAWLMNGVTVVNSGFMPTVADMNWEIKGVGDLDGDGKADVLLRNKSTGQIVGWLMNGLTVWNSAFMLTVDTNWDIAGIGDLNGDGKADVVLRNKVTGQNVAWLMSGLTVWNSAFLPTVADLNWDIKGLGDLDGDGKADVILRNKVTGQYVAWLMNGMTVVNSAFLPTLADTNWDLKGVGDLDRDGKADIVLRNKVSGQDLAWLMNGLTVVTSAALPTVADVNWDISGLGDLDGDGRVDIILHNNVTGQSVAWLMNGVTVVNSAFLPTLVDTNWEVAGP